MRVKSSRGYTMIRRPIFQYYRQEFRRIADAVTVAPVRSRAPCRPALWRQLREPDIAVGRV